MWMQLRNGGTPILSSSITKIPFLTIAYHHIKVKIEMRIKMCKKYVASFVIRKKVARCVRKSQEEL